jgi:hypothetical protein
MNSNGNYEVFFRYTTKISYGDGHIPVIISSGTTDLESRFLELIRSTEAPGYYTSLGIITYYKK